MNSPRTHDHHDFEFDDKPLTPDENRRFRRMARDDDRVRYLWTTLRLFVGYVTAAIIGIGLATGYLKDLLKGLAR
jgi:hypothetical protein